MDILCIFGSKLFLFFFFLALIILNIFAPADCFAQTSTHISHLTILHTNDTHGFLTTFDTEKGYNLGGAAGRATLINEIRRSNKENGNRHTLLLDGGDMLENNAMSNFFKGEADIAAMNLMGYEAMAFGNHDFGFGMDHFLTLAKKASFPILSANVLDSKTGGYIFKPYIVKNYNGVRIAIFGLTSHTLFYNSMAADLKKITFIDKHEAYAKILPQMKSEAELIIFLSHLGLEEDREFAKMHPEINLIVGSHSHTYLEQPEKIGSTYIFQAGKYGECLGRIDLTFAGAKMIDLKSRLIYVADRKMGELVKTYKDRLDPQINIKLGELGATLENLDKYDKPTPLFGFVLKILRDKFDADFAMETGASIGGRLETGPIYLKQIYRMMPYNNFAVVINMKGSEIKKLMDYSVSKSKSMYYVQAYGLSYESLNGASSNIMIGGKPLDENKIYRVATDNYMSAGGAEDGILKNIEPARKNASEVLIRDLVIEYIKRNVKI